MASTRLGIDRKKLSPSELVEVSAQMQPKAWPLLGRIPHLIEESAESDSSRERLLGAENEASKLILAGLAKGSFGRPELPVSSMGAAVREVGTAQIAEAVVAAHWLLAIADLCKTAGIPMRPAFSSSITSAVVAREIGESFGLSPLHSYCAGLLHNCGVPFLAALYGEAYSGMALEPGETLAHAEHRLFGIDHTQAGLVVLIHRGFPPFICEAAAFHHGYVDRMPLAGRIAACAELISTQPESRSALHDSAALVNLPLPIIESAARLSRQAEMGVHRLLG